MENRTKKRIFQPKKHEKLGFFQGSGYQIHEKAPEIAEKSSIFGDNFHYFLLYFHVVCSD